MTYSEKKKAYNQDYNKKNYKRIPLDVRRDNYDEIKAAADLCNEKVNEFIKKSIANRLSTLPHVRNHDFMVYYSNATDKERELLNKFEGFQPLFGDMLFKSGFSTHDFISIQYQDNNSDEWYDSELDLPESLQYLDVGCKILIRDLEDDTCGQYNFETRTITIDTKSQDSDSVLLHEMIHVYEHVIDEHLAYYRDAIFICLYRDLKNRIPNLDDIILEHGHIYNQNEIATIGGIHSIFFLLKSFDIDTKMNYPLGTTFDYGNDFNNHTYHE